MTRSTILTTASGVLGAMAFATAAIAEDEYRVLKRGTEVPAVVVQNLSVEKNGIGERVWFRVDEDVEVDGEVVVYHGTLIRGRVGEVKRGKGLSKRGELTLYAETTKAIDDSLVPLEKVELGAMGNTGEGGATKNSIVWGGLGARSKYRASYVLNGTPYLLTVAEDVSVNIDDPVYERKREERKVRMDGKVTNSQKVKLFAGRSKKEVVKVRIDLPQKVKKKQVKRGFGPDDVVLVSMMETELPEPVTAWEVKVNNKKLEVSFEAWEILQYAVPGEVGLEFQVEVGGGQKGVVDVTLDADFAL